MSFPLFSSPAFSILAVWCRIFQSHIFLSRIFSVPSKRSKVKVTWLEMSDVITFCMLPLICVQTPILYIYRGLKIAVSVTCESLSRSSYWRVSTCCISSSMCAVRFVDCGRCVRASPERNSSTWRSCSLSRSIASRWRWKGRTFLLTAWSVSSVQCLRHRHRLIIIIIIIIIITVIIALSLFHSRVLQYGSPFQT